MTGAHRQSGRSLFALVVLLIAATSSGCDNYASARQRLGVRLSSSNTIEITYLACNDETIQKVQLWRLDGDNVAGEAGDEIIWSDSPTQDAARRGVIPIKDSGVQIGLKSKQKYWVEIFTSRNSADSDGFELSDLKPAEVYVGGSLRSVSQYENRARSSCGSP